MSCRIQCEQDLELALKSLSFAYETILSEEAKLRNLRKEDLETRRRYEMVLDTDSSYYGNNTNPTVVTDENMLGTLAGELDDICNKITASTKARNRSIADVNKLLIDLHSITIRCASCPD